MFVKVPQLRRRPYSLTPLQQPPPDQKNCPLKLSTSQPSIGVEKQFPCKNQIQKSGRFRDRHFCLYFELGCELGPSEAQAQNTSRNDDFKNGPLFDMIFTWELIFDTLLTEGWDMLSLVGQFSQTGGGC